MAQKLVFDSSPSRIETRFDPSIGGRGLRDDPAMAGSDHELAQRLPDLLISPDWEDRVRARFVIAALADQATLPNSFPVLMESRDSPSLIKSRALTWTPASHVWVAHPDRGVLEELLEDYQAMWDGYTSQWGPTSRRLFVVTQLDNVRVSCLRRPECTADDILVDTAATHSFQQHLRADLRTRR